MNPIELTRSQESARALPRAFSCRCGGRFAGFVPPDLSSGDELACLECGRVWIWWWVDDREVQIRESSRELPDEARSLLASLVADQLGHSAIEYGLIGSLIFLVFLTAFALFANNATLMWASIASHLGG